MIKKKGAGMVMTIMLVSGCGWVAIVAFVIKPNMWVGFALCLGGGSLIGLAIVYLMWRWWLKRSVPIEIPNLKRPTSNKLNQLGTRFQSGVFAYRYFCAGEEIKKGTMVEAGLAGRLVIGEPLPEGKEMNDLIYGDVRPTLKVDRYGSSVLGWPLVNVKKYHYGWLQEPPLGAEFAKEDGEEK